MKTRLNAKTQTFSKSFDDALPRARAQGEGYSAPCPPLKADHPLYWW